MRPEIGGTAYVADVADPDGLRDAFDAAATAMGGITVLYNNAGIGRLSPAGTSGSPRSGTAWSRST